MSSEENIEVIQFGAQYSASNTDAMIMGEASIFKQLADQCGSAIDEIMLHHVIVRSLETTIVYQYPSSKHPDTINVKVTRLLEVRRGLSERGFRDT